MSGRALQTLIALILAGLWGAWLGAVHWRGDTWFLERVEATMTDLRTLARGKRAAPDLVTIVAIDDEAVRLEGSYPLARVTLARIVDAVARFEPKVVAIDMLLVDAGPEDGDQALARALSGRPSVIAAAAVFSEVRQLVAAGGDESLARVPSAERFLLPLKTFSDVSAVGVVNVATDQTGTPRALPMLFRTGDQLEASFPLRVAALAAGENPGIEPNRLWLGDRLIRTDVGHALPIDFYGPGGTIRTISAAALLNGHAVERDFRDRVVVVGATVTGGGDVFPTPFDPVLPGVEVISTAIAHLMAGDGIVRDRTVRLGDAGVAVVLPMVLIGLLAWRRSAIGFAAIFGVVLVWLAFNLAAFEHGVWLSVALPVAAAAPPVILFGAAQLWLGRRRALYFARQSALLQRVQAPGLAKWLAEHDAFLAEPVRADAAVVFIDISGFTGLSEIMGPRSTRELLNGFYALVDEEVANCGGVISSFMGDGAMIVFGLPEPGPGDAANAALCCVGLANRTAGWLASLPPSTGSRIGFKIGAHFGTIVASRLGGDTHQHIAVTGDTVNIASRLMEVAAAHGAAVALSDEMLHVAGNDSALSRSGLLRGPVETQIRGRVGSLAVWLWERGEVRA